MVQFQLGVICCVNARVDAEAQTLAQVLDEIDLEEDSNNDFIDDDPFEFVE
jgi:hypothetical protein